MAVTMAEITKLRALTSAGLMDCKKALAETNGDIPAAVEILRKKGQAVAAKREDRQASEGCVLAKNEGEFAAIVALNCETDFVAKNAGFVALATKILDLAMAQKPATLDDLKNLELEGRKVSDLIVEEIGKTGEKMEISAYETVKAPSTSSYVHPGNRLATIVGFNLPNVDYQVGRDVAMQVAAMNPVSVSRDTVPADILENEKKVAVEKTQLDLIKKAVDQALSKAGFNLYICENDEHLNEGVMKGIITEAQVEEIKKIKADVAEKKAASLPEAMVQNIATGRVNKFFKESCLMEQENVKDSSVTVGQFLDKAQKGLVAVDFKRVNLNQD